MFGIPKPAEVSKFLPKKAILEKLGLSAAERTNFDADIAKITIIAEISPRTLSVSAEEKIRSFYVLLVSLKRKDFSGKNIEKLSRVIKQNILFILEFENSARLAIVHNRLICGNWILKNELSIPFEGTDMGRLWENIFQKVAVESTDNFLWDFSAAIRENFERLELVAKCNKEIENLRARIHKETQPKKKFELNAEIKSKIACVQELLNGKNE